MRYNPSIVTAFFKEHGIREPTFEYRFHPDRKWRFDMAWPDPKLYVECDGGIWIAGGHNRGAQMKKDWEKRNAATVLGWRGLWFEPRDLLLTTTAETIRKAMSGD